MEKDLKTNLETNDDNGKGNDLQHHLMRLARMLRRRPADGGRISRSGLQLIEIIMEEDGIRTSDLAERLDLRPSSLTDLLKRMEEEGDVARVRDENDSRVVRVYATQQARGALAQRQAERARQAESLRAHLGAEEYAAFCATCDKLSDFLEAEYAPEGCRHGHCGAPHRGGHGRHGAGEEGRHHHRRHDPYNRGRGGMGGAR